MKIGIYDPYLDDIGGGERYMMTIAKCLSEIHSVDVFWNKREDLKKIENRFSLDLSKVNIKENIFSGKTSFFDKQKISRFYDIFIVLSDGSIPVLSSKKLYLHMQQPISHKLSLKDRLKLKRVDGIFCNSRFTKDFIEKNYKVKCNLLYPPVSIFGNSAKKENIIFHVGRFRVINVKSVDYKKQQVMIDAFKEMIDAGLKDWKLVLAVSLPDEKEERFLKMKDSAKGYPIEFMVNSSNKELLKEESKAKIYWHATGFGEDLKNNPQLAEHFGISTVEAMGEGLVPVVINAGGQKEIVTDGKDGFLWETIDELKHKTLKLTEDEKLREKIAGEAFKKAKEYDEENFQKRVFEIIS